MIGAFLNDDEDVPNYLIDVPNPDKPKALNPDLVKVHRNALDRAIDKLQQFATDDKGRIAVPWKIKPRPKVKDTQWSEAPLRSFPIERLHATQQFLNRDTVQWHLEHLGDNAADNKSMPNIVVDNNEFLIYDGHHRLAALWLLGADYANCWKVEL